MRELSVNEVEQVSGGDNVSFGSFAGGFGGGVVAGGEFGSEVFGFLGAALGSIVGPEGTYLGYAAGSYLGAAYSVELGGLSGAYAGSWF